MKPRLMIVDLQGLPDPRGVLSELGALMDPDRALVITALGTVTAEEIRRLGFRVFARPAGIDQIVAAASRLLKTPS
jgi:hypothetical protein